MNVLVSACLHMYKCFSTANGAFWYLLSGIYLMAILPFRYVAFKAAVATHTGTSVCEKRMNVAWNMLV